MKKTVLLLLLASALIFAFTPQKHVDKSLTGTIVAFGGLKTKIPDGWALCDGSLQKTNDRKYSDLYKVIGTAWGGRTSGYFALPDLRGQFLRGVSEDINTDPEKEGRLASRPDLIAASNTDGISGNSGNSVGSKQEDMVIKHAHDIGGLDAIGKGCNSTLSGCGPANAQHPTAPYGGSETRPKNAYVYYIIKL